MWAYSYSHTALRISIPIQKANLLKMLLKNNSHLILRKMIEKGFKYRNINLTTYRYRKLQKLETQIEVHLYIDRVKGGYSYSFIKNGGYSLFIYLAELKRWLFGLHILTIPYIGSYHPDSFLYITLCNDSHTTLLA